MQTKIPNFGYVPVDEETKAKMQIFRDEFQKLADLIAKENPSSRGLSLAMTKLEEASFWLNKAITKND